MTQPQNTAFTVRASGRLLRLITEIEIFAPFPATLASVIQPPTQGRKYQGLYDTGATNSAISPHVVDDFQLASIGARTVGVGGGSLPTTAHLVNIALPNKLMFPMVPVTKMVLLGGIDVLIGMDILGVGDFAVTHYGGKTVFSFCVPSRKELDFVAEMGGNQPQTKRNASAVPQVPRNAPCSCGSGKKYKACHGKHF